MTEREIWMGSGRDDTAPERVREDRCVRASDVGLEWLTIGEALYTLRRRHGLRQGQMSAALGLGGNVISRIELGTRRALDAELRWLSRLFCVNFNGEHRVMERGEALTPCAEENVRRLAGRATGT